MRLVSLGAFVSCVASFAVSFAGPPAGEPRSLSFEERVECQRRVEQVYWDHRIWPKENPLPKPPLAEVLPDAALRQRVADQLGYSVALEVLWSRPLTGAQLQAEIDRMIRDTKKPQVLRELFTALDDDPFLVAECLARPLLVTRLARDWYARDARFHGELRAQAEAALAAAPGVALMKQLGGDYSELEYRLADDPERPAPVGDESAAGSVIELSREEWTERIDRIAGALGSGPVTAAAELPVGRVSPLLEESDGFGVLAVVASASDSLRVASVTWHKPSLESWWLQDGREMVGDPSSEEASVVPPSGGYAMGSILDDGCIDDTWLPTREDLPQAREYHTAVWTGTEMIVWGGYAARYLNSGGRYDPTTDTWTPTPTAASVPAARAYHTAVWTGSEMIVWGGASGSMVNSGGRYDPLTDTWVPTSTGTNVPVARYDHTAVWTGTGMIVWGGYASYSHFNSGGRYDPSTDTWVPTSTGTNVPAARRGHTAVWTGTEMIVWGGSGSSSLNSGGRYDPSTDAWVPSSTSTNVPSARFGHTAVWTGAEMIVWGGYPNLNNGGRYDPTADTWTPTSSGAGTPTGRYDHTAVWTGTEMIVWGGRGYLNSGGRYDPTSDAWATTSTGAGVPTGRYDHTAVWTGTVMIVWGGWNADGYLASGSRYDAATDTWTPTLAGAPDVPTVRRWHTAVWTGAEMIIWGGGKSSDGSLNSGGRYDPTTDTWTPTSMGAGVPTGRSGHTAVWTGTEMIIWGGGGLNSGGRYNPTTDTWTPTSTGAGVPTGRSGHTAVWTGTETIVWGGQYYGSVNSGGRYDPLTDTWVPTSTGTNVPVARYDHTAVWTGTEMIVWGGADGMSNRSGGRYDPTTDTWVPTSTGAGVPTGRVYHTAVWTGTEMIIWGGLGGGYLNSGGRYRPSTDTWTATSTGAGLPTIRQDHTATWTGTEMIVWGGYGGAELNSGGRYDPMADHWLPTSVGNNVPTQRTSHSTVWTGMEMIVWGGYGLSYLNTGARYCACLLEHWWPDCDSDGHGDSLATPIGACDQPSGSCAYVADATDCDDTDEARYPGNPETCDGKDNDCDTVVDQGGDALCNDGSVCTTDTCNGLSGCSHGASGACGVSGRVRYYRTHLGGGAEPTDKRVAGVGIDANADATANATTDAQGDYGVPSLFGNVTIATLPRWGTPRAADHNGSVTSYDATLTAQHAVGLISLSGNQQLAADASGVGGVSSYDASLIAQFAVIMIDHLPVATAAGSDWRYRRCDSYVDEDNHTCGPPAYQHTPLLASATDDDFYAILYGDVSGSWSPAGSFASEAELLPEEREAMLRDAELAARLAAAPGTAWPPSRRDEPAVLSLTGWPLRVQPGTRYELTLEIEHADGIQALDLTLTYDPVALAVLALEPVGLAADYRLDTHDTGGRLKAALYGVIPLSGSGPLLTITVEPRAWPMKAAPFAIDALANEGLIPLTRATAREDRNRRP